MSLRKTLIYIEESQLKELRRRSRRSGRSMASLAREAIAHYLVESTSRPLEGFIGCADGPPNDDASERADDILKDLLG